MAGGAPFRLAELAELVGGRIEGDGDRRLEAVRPLEEAGPRDLAFLLRPRFRAQAVASRAGALVVPPAAAAEPGIAGRPLLVTPRPDLALARILTAFHPPEAAPAGVHPTAVVEEGCAVDPSAAIGPFAVVGAGSRIAAGAVVGAHAVVGRGCVLGAGAMLHPHAVLYPGTELGERTVVHAGVVLGSDGFGYVAVEGSQVKVPQVGRVVVEDDVEIGANSAVDRATLGTTRLGTGTKVDNLVQVGHNVRVGRHCVLCGQAGIAGSATLGEGVVVAGQAGVGGHLTLGDGVQVGAKSAALHSVAAGQVAGIPAVPLARWRRQAAIAPRLGEILRRLRALERRLGTEGSRRGKLDEEE